MERKELILDVAAAVADGTAVDWQAAAQSITSDEERRLLPELQLIADLSRDTPTDAPSRSWGPLDIIEHVGHGTFGDVYRAWDRRLDREVALKILRRAEPDDQAHASAVIQEGRLLARVRHSNVVTVYGAERVNGQIGVWMEFVHGNTLQEELRDRGPFGVDRVISIGIELSGALSTVHRAGLIHGDVKAHNVLCDRDGRLVLTDFGAGIALDATADDAAGEPAATPLCVAPEVLAGNPASARSDLYSLAVLLYYLLTGMYPVRGRSLKEVREAHAARTWVSLQQARPELRPDLVRIIDRALDPDPLVRHETLDLFHAELKRLVATSTGAQRSGTVPPTVRSGRRATLAVLLILAVGIVSMGVWRTAATPTSQAGAAASPATPLLVQNVTVIEFPGATRTELHEISDSGAIVGSYIDNRDKTHGFLLMEGNFRTIDVPGAIRTRPTGLNDGGTVVGDYSDSGGTTHGFVLAANNFSVIDVPNATFTRAGAVNSAGTIVGDYRDANGRSHGFILRDAAFSSIDVPGAVSTRAIGLNDAGSVVGDYSDASGGQFGFLFANNHFTTIQVPGTRVTQAFGLNAQGTAVGSSGAVGFARGFSFSDNQVTLLEVPGAVWMQAVAINSSGVIVGTYRSGDPPKVRGFLLTP